MMINSLINKIGKEKAIEKIEKNTSIDAFSKETLKRRVNESLENDSFKMDSTTELLVAILEAKTEELEISKIEAGKILRLSTEDSKLTDEIVEKMNSIYKEVKSYYPTFDLFDEDLVVVADGKAIGMMDELVKDLISEMNESSSDLEDLDMKILEAKFNEDFGNSSNKIKALIFEIFDASSIELAYGYIFGKFKTYSKSMRDEIYNYVIENPETKETKVIVGSVAEGVEVADINKSDLTKFFDEDTVLDIITNDTPIMLRRGLDRLTYNVINTKPNQFKVYTI